MGTGCRLTGKAKLYKKSTQEMLADLFTKPLDAGRMKMLLEKLNYRFCGGRHHLALMHEEQGAEPG